MQLDPPNEEFTMQRTSVRRALALAATMAAVTCGGAFAIGTASVSTAAPVEENRATMTV